MTSSILLHASVSSISSLLGRASGALACALALTWAAQANAASPADQATAKSAAAAAQKAYALGKFEEAIAGYSQAYDLSELPTLLFNIAQCHRQLRDYKRAAFFYQRYLSLQPAPIENEQLTRSLLAEMELATEAQEAAQAPPPEPAAAPRPALEAAPAESVAPPADPATSDEVSRPLLKQWWLWTVVGAAAVGAAVTAGVLATRNHPAPTSLGEIRF